MQTLRFQVYNAALNFMTNSDRISSEIRKDFGRFEIKKSLKIDGEVKFIEKDWKFPLQIPKYAIQESAFSPDRATYILSDQRFFEEKDKCIVKIDLKENEIVGYYRPPYDISLLARFLLKWVFIKILESKDVFFIHGSGVTKDRISSFFVGQSGFGKTSILISFLQEGYKMITDDTILLTDGRVLPFYIRSRVYEKTLQRFPILKKGLNENSTFIPKQGWFIDLSDIFPVEKEEVQPSNLISIYIWNSVETKIEEISRKEMLSRLLHIYQNETRNSFWFGWNQGDIMRKLFASYYSLVENSDCYKVFAGSDVSRFVKAVEAVLE